MRRIPLDVLAREMLAAADWAQAPTDSGSRFTPRIMCLSARVAVLDAVGPGWDPGLYDWVPQYGLWRRVLGRLRSLPFAARLWPSAPSALLLVVAKPGRVRMTLNGQRADTSMFNDRSTPCPN